MTPPPPPFNLYPHTIHQNPSCLYCTISNAHKSYLLSLSEHQYEGGVRMGYDVDGSGVATCDAMLKGIFDLYLVKLWALKFATNAASTVLKVDEIIMAKPAGGPKPQKKAGWDEDADE